MWSDTDHGYSPAYFPVIGWQVLCGVASLVVMLFKCRLKSGRRRLWPAIPMALSLAYLALNYMGVPWLRALFGDVTAFQIFLYMLSFEACIACGFIHSNSRYADLFASSAGTSAQITSKSFHVRYAALNTRPIGKGTMAKAAEAPVTIGGGLICCNRPPKPRSTASPSGTTATTSPSPTAAHCPPGPSGRAAAWSACGTRTTARRSCWMW